jgi:hypothetical protein
MVTRSYVQDCRSGGSRLTGVTREIQLPEIYGRSFGGLLLDRPLFVDEREITAFGTDLRGLLDILTSLPGRVFGGDSSAYCAALGIAPRLADLLLRDEGLEADVLARADAYHDGTSFRLLELNVGSELGGMDAAQLNRAYLQVPAFADFARRHGLGYVDTAGLVAGALRAAGTRVTGRPDPSVALIESPGGLAEHEHVFLALQEAMAGHGLDLMLGEITDLTEQDGRTLLGGRPVDVVLRFFVGDELVDNPAARAAFDRLVAAHRDGRTALFTPLHVGVFASKANLALLHDPFVREVLDPSEHELVDRIVPWTRTLGPGPGTGPAGRADPGEQAGLLARCRAEQQDLVIKPGIAYGGVGTLIGRDTSAQVWREALASGADGTLVVQELVRPVAETVIDAGTGEAFGWQANWGIFANAQGYAGGFVRALRPEHGSVISYSNPGTRGTCVFTAPNRSADRTPTKPGAGLGPG